MRAAAALLLVASAPPAYAEDGLAELLVGGWTDNGDCNDTIEMRDDNSFVMSDGGQGSWALEGNALTLSGEAGRVKIQIEMQSEDAMSITNADGSPGRSTRCW